MNCKTVIFVCLTVLGVSCSTHHPKVYEDDAEYSKTENIRTARNSETPYRTVHRPPVFNYQSAKQQDYLKYRYVAQQKANSAMADGLAKSPKYLNPQNLYTKTIQGVEDTDDWQPFDPKLSKHHTRVFPGVLHLKTTKDIKIYKPSLLKVVLPPKNNPVNFLNEASLSNSTDLLTQGSEIVEKKVEFRELPQEYSKVIFVPNQLQEQLKQNSGENLAIKKPETQLSALNDLIGKNPNVQLEGLKRLLQDTSPKNYNFPVIQGPEPFHSRDQTPSTEEAAPVSNTELKPNIQVNHDDNSVTIQAPHGIEKSSLEDLQKQLDEAAKLQAEKVLAQAQQQAQAQVEAQHKAIALAQVQAQKEALENLQKSIYGNPQALPLVQNNFGTEYDANSLQSQAPVAHNNPLTTNDYNHNKFGQNPLNSLDNESTKKVVSQIETKTHVNDIPVPKKPVTLYQHAPSHSFGSKELLYYAPNHHHQAVAQLQAQKALLTQVKAQNMAILQSHKNVASSIRQILKAEQVGNAEQKHASSVHSAAETELQPTAYQHVVLEGNEEDAAEEQKDYDDLDEYAAKYAFGYRIKDAKEGNDFGHEERRNGKSLEGSYHVLLPDGRLQKVEYYADNSGYHAKVTYKHVSEEEGTI